MITVNSQLGKDATTSKSVQWTQLSDFTFRKLQEDLRKAHNLVGNFDVKYEDEDGDMITISSDLDIHDALAYSTGPDNVIGLVIDKFTLKSLKDVKETEEREESVPEKSENDTKPASIEPPREEAVPQKAVHQDIRCDQCNCLPIVGKRFKCVVCEDFDLCEKCEKLSTAHPLDHPLILIKKPEDVDDRPVHHGITCDGCDNGFIKGDRYACIDCPDFDLCSECEEKCDENIHPQSHTMVKIRVPGSLPRPILKNMRGCSSYGKGNTDAIKETVRAMASPENFVASLLGYGRPRRHGRGCGKKKWRQTFSEKKCRKQERERDSSTQKQASCSSSSNNCADKPVEIDIDLNPLLNAFGFNCVPAQQKSQQKLEAQFLSDSTLPDDCVVDTKSTLIKSWKVLNSGNKAWPEGTKLVFIRGDRELSVEEEFPVGSLEPGASGDVSVVLQMPDNPGKYSIYYQLADADRKLFGCRLWCRLNVEEPKKHSSALLREIVQKAQSTDNKSSSNTKDEVVDTSNVVESSEHMKLDEVSSDKTPLLSPTSEISTASDNSESDIVVVNAPSPKENVQAGSDASYTSISCTSKDVVDPPEADKKLPAVEYEDQLKILKDMGFVNEEMNKFILLKHNGNFRLALKDLLDFMKKSQQ
jgi:hypothetical protein